MTVDTKGNLLSAGCQVLFANARKEFVDATISKISGDHVSLITKGHVVQRKRHANGEVLGVLLTKPVKADLTDRIMECICRHFSIGPQTLLSDSHKRETVLPRAIYVHFMHQLQFSTPYIAGTLNFMQTTKVRYATRLVKRALETKDPLFLVPIDQLTPQIQEIAKNE